ncbi:MAG: hypothetical protein OXQ84_03685 [bacterium]|nr:hypothetical protein [bacterium]
MHQPANGHALLFPERRDFEDLGGYDQVGRALKGLAAKGQLVKIGCGPYARAATSPISGRTVVAKPLPTLETLESLDAETMPSTIARTNNAGISTQTPTGRVIAVRSRISRKIGCDGTYLSYERPSLSTAS